MNTWTVIWTVLPHGVVPPGAAAPSVPGRLRLSLMPTLRVVTDDALLRSSDARLWPTRIAPVRSVQLQLAGPDATVPGTVVSPPPDQRLWDALFGPATPVQPPEDEGPIFVPVVTSVHYGPVLAALDRVYGQALAAEQALPADHPALRTVRGLSAWSTDATLRSAAAGVRAEVDRLLEPAALTAARVGEAAALLRGQGEDAAADALPLALVARRLAATGAGPMVAGAKAPPQQPSPVKGIRPIERADFHQVAGLVTDHPALALALGLRVDVEIDAFAGDRSIRLVTAGTPLHGPGTIKQPWSRVSAGPTRFVMAARDGRSEVANGVVDLSPPGKYVSTTADVVGEAEQLRALAGTLASTAAPAEVGLPTRRNTGITLAQVDRRAEVVTPSLAQSSLIAEQLGVPQGELLLFADDVTAGYRVDVSVDGGPFRSLMRRRISYSLNPAGTKDPVVLTAADEGTVEALTMAEQYDADGVPHLTVGEQLFAFDGWSMVVPRPGRRVTGETAGGGGVGDVDPGMAPGYPLAQRVDPEPGTVTPLRYGRSYRFQARAVDLAGNSLDPAAVPADAASPPVPYLRLDPVLPPVRVPRRPFSFGESLDRMVVRTDGEGNPVDARGQATTAPNERHLAAPKTTQQLAETHGGFDAAFGPRATQDDRDRAYALARTEEGVLTDLTVPDPADPRRRIPAEGIAVVANDGALPPPKGLLPIRRGTALPAGTYVVHDTDRLVLPYLPDLPAGGVALSGLPGAAGPTPVPYGGDWPLAAPARLRVHPGGTGATTVTGSVVDVTVPPATEVVTELSSTLRPGTVADFAVPPELRKAAAAGQLPLVSPRDRMVLVHAVRKPLLPLAVTAATLATRKRGSTSAELSGSVTCHPGSTARVDLEALWTEPLDDGTSPVTEAARSATGEPLPVGAGQDRLDWTITQHFGDTRRRDVTVRPIGTTRFREYFAPVPDGDPALTRTGAGQVVVVPNAARPEPPDVHSVLPVFEWQRTFEGGVWSSRRLAVGFRVWLRRPWLRTGTGEKLGLVVFRDTFVGAGVMTAGHPLSRLVTRWGTDPLESPQDAQPLIDAQVRLTEPADGSVRPLLTGAPLLESGANAGVGAGATTIIGHEVRYDAGRDLWYADIEFRNLPDQRFHFMRLALVRYQPESVPGCHVSRVVLTDFVQLPPSRFLSVSRQPGNLLQVRVVGDQLRAGSIRAQLVRSVRGGGIVEDLQVANLADAPVPATLAPRTYSGLVDVGPAVGAPQDFHLVVRELQFGDHLHQPTGITRTVWFDVVEGDRLAQLLG